jgi:hypothetical protein
MENTMCRLILAGLALATPASASDKAPEKPSDKARFFHGTYTFALGACAKLKALAAGGVQAISTVPWYVTEDGVSSWEGGCSFTKISKGKRSVM